MNELIMYNLQQSDFSKNEICRREDYSHADIAPFTTRFRRWLNSIKYSNIDIVEARASELHPELTKGFPFWFILKKLEPDSAGPTIRSEEKMSALLRRWDNLNNAESIIFKA